MKNRKCVASKGLTGAFFGCVAKKGVTGEFSVRAGLNPGTTKATKPFWVSLTAAGASGFFRI